MWGERPAIGARVEVLPVETGVPPRSRVDELRAGGSYASSHAPEVHFGIGDATKATVFVTWPDGSRKQFDDLSGGMRHRLWPRDRDVESTPFQRATER